MDIKENNFDCHSESLVKCAQLLDHLIESITGKSSEINDKISVLLKKINLKLEDVTQFLILQRTILENEMDYLKKIKSIISTDIKTQLLTLSENIVMFVMSVQNVYKEIPNVEIKHPQVSSKKDNISKIINDINVNLNCLRQILLEFDQFNKKFTESISKGNFHVITLSSDMRTVYTHILLEYNKYVNDTASRMEYYNMFAINVMEQLPNMKICNYYLPPDIVTAMAATVANLREKRGSDDMSISTSGSQQSKKSVKSKASSNLEQQEQEQDCFSEGSEGNIPEGVLDY
jgi:hypothetical protein